MTSPAERERDEVYEICIGLVERLINGTRRVMEIERKQPHYIAGLTIAAGCEAVGRLMESVDAQRREPWTVFVEDLLLPHGQGVSAAMGRDIFDALRNGVAHTFETKRIVLKDGRSLELMLNWEGNRPHLSVHPRGIILNLRVMQEDFERVLTRYRDTCLATSTPGRRLNSRWREYAERRSEDGADTGWRTFWFGKGYVPPAAPGGAET